VRQEKELIEMEIIPGLLLLAVSLGIYFIPYIVARQNGKQNSGAIGALNFFLGWTLVGWVVALVWAMSKDANVVPQPAPVAMNTTPALSPRAAQKKCPDCAEMILADARKCRFCGHEFGPPCTSLSDSRG
jgi:hypothetical protein